MKIRSGCVGSEERKGSRMLQNEILRWGPSNTTAIERTSLAESREKSSNFSLNAKSHRKMRNITNNIYCNDCYCHKKNYKKDHKQRLFYAYT